MRWEIRDNYVRDADGNIIGGVFQSQTVHDMTCKKCNSSYLSKGIFGGLKEIMFGDLCDRCIENTETEQGTGGGND